MLLKLFKSKSRAFKKISFLSSRRLYAVTEVTMPALSPSMEQGTITKWKFKEGDEIEDGDSLADIETDKANMSLDLQEGGFLAKILHEEGVTKKVGEPIALMVEDESELKNISEYKISGKGSTIEKDKKSESSEIKSDDKPKKVVEDQNQKSTSRVFSSPLAKSVAKEKGIPLNEIKGTGPNNRIIKADVDEYKKDTAHTQVKSTPSESGIDYNKYSDIPVSNVRKVIANRLLESKTTIPHFYLTVECEVDELLKARKHLNENVGSKQGFKLSVNDFIIKAAGRALNKVPAVNSSWMGDFIREYKEADISIAVQTDNGLITPIVTNVNGRGLSDISNNVKSLAKKARESSLQPHEFQGGTFTISNLGMFGVNEFSAIINPPQSAILAVGTAVKSVRPSGDSFKSATTMKVTLSCDHRVIDGAVGAQWLQSFKENIEDPLHLLL